MRAILRLFWNICLYRVGPEQVPVATVLLVLTALVDLLIGMGWQASLNGESLFTGFLSVAIVWLAGQAIIILLLLFKHFNHRIVPTLSAWNGTDVILSCVLISVQLLAVVLRGVPAFSRIAGFAVIAVLVWDALVKGFIFSRSLNMTRFQGTALAVAFNVLMFWCSKLLMGF